MVGRAFRLAVVAGVVTATAGFYTVSDEKDAVQPYIDAAKGKLSGFVQDRLEKLLEDTFTDTCREQVTDTFVDVMGAVLTEDWLPFEQSGPSIL